MIRVNSLFGSVVFSIGVGVLLSELSGLWRTFGEDNRKITKKAQTPEPAARAVCLRPYKTSEISNRLAGLRANEQYHQMYARAQIAIKATIER
jgi:hypothetical protein